MSFEFNQQDTCLNDFPNPFRFENTFLAISAAMTFFGGIAIIVQAKEFFEIRQDKLALVAVGVAILVLGLATKLLIQVLSQLRFYLGRKFPNGLAGELALTDTGMGRGSEEIMEMLRHRAIAFPEPKGALNGVLYSLVKDLITSPAELQAAAVQHFHALIAMSSLLASLLVSYMLFAGSPSEGIASWLYLPMSGLSLLTPFVQRDRLNLNDSGSADHLETGDKALVNLIGLIAFSIMAPVLIPRFAPHLSIAPLWIPPAVLLSGSIIACALFFAAIVRDLDSARETNVSCEQTTIAMNCPPAQLWREIDRDFQRSWERGIPNRAYANVPPEVASGERGSFGGLVLEETQPVPTSTRRCSTWTEALQTPCHRFLLLLGGWGATMAAACALTATRSAEQFANMSRLEISRSILIVMAFGMVTALSFRIAHLLWSRMQFKSRLVWIETSGVFQASQISIGNRFRAHAQSSSTLTRVEDATLRVWAADIVSVAFGKDGRRCIIAMTQSDNVAKSTADRLLAFAANQSVVAIPTADRDLARSSLIGGLDSAVRASTLNTFGDGPLCAREGSF
jgi:hypothetical protein